MRKLMKPLLLSVGLVVCPTLAICQQPVPATLSLADAISLARQHNPAYRQAIHDRSPAAWGVRNAWSSLWLPTLTASGGVDRKSTRLNSSHRTISYAVFCLKKKKKKNN